jgi:hypothetical protein
LGSRARSARCRSGKQHRRRLVEMMNNAYNRWTQVARQFYKAPEATA